MIIFPAIDLLDGKCVRLYQGDYNKSERVANNPLEVVADFKRHGAKYLHVVDLNSARDGGDFNFETIKMLTNQGLKVQTGGGVRSIQKIRNCLSSGVERVIIGSQAVKDKEFLKEALKLFGNKIIVGIDAKDGLVRTSGWTENSNIHYIDLAKEMKKLGVRTIAYTDIAKDGTMTGVDYDGTKSLCQNVDIDIIASGGVNSYEDLVRLKSLDIYGFIIGKSIYSGAINLENLNLKEGKII